MSLKTALAVWAGRLAGWGSRLSGRGGSSLPGLVARRISPEVLTQLSTRLRWGSALITGTNGKTTTAAMVRRMLDEAHIATVSNRAGANLILGLTAAFVQLPRRMRYQTQVALLETDEATMPQAGRELIPRVVVVTNFFRDQLDRYGELSTTVRYVARGIASISANGVLVLNADDPQVAGLGTDHSNVIYYGLDSTAVSPNVGEDTIDARYCPHCGSALTYARRYYAHLGHYRCLDCGWIRPQPQIAVSRWDREAQKAWIIVNGEEREFGWQIPGLYNLYNLAAALSTGVALNIPLETIQASLEGFKPAFGRMESLTINSSRLWLALVKNPVGFTQVLAMIGEDTQHAFSIMILINDKYADGRDVSWLWDVDFEYWVERLPAAVWYVGGIRARDMAVRLKYAGVERARTVVEESVPVLLDRAVADAKAPTLYILPTYTAMLEVRQQLTQRGLAPHFRKG